MKWPSRRNPGNRRIIRYFEQLESRQMLTANVVINEFMAANQKSITDGFGSSADWIELFNSGDTALDLSNHHLTDDADNLSKWTFPDGTEIKPSEYLLVFASGFDTTDNDGIHHTNFRLNPGGDYLALTSSDLQVISEYGKNGSNFPNQFGDISYGIQIANNDPQNSPVGFLSTPTPGTANQSEILNIGPRLSKVTNKLDPIPATENLVVTSRVVDYLSDLKMVNLTYRIMYQNEITVEMRDDGNRLISGDLVASDGIFSAIILASEFKAGEMVRWYISASDVEGNESRSPAYLDQSGTDRSPEYYGTIVADADVQSNLNLWQWYIDPDNQRRADTTSGTRSSLYYGGEFYDNVFVRVRGGSSAGLRKKSYKFDFNTGNDFRFDPDFGRVREINVNTTFSNKDYIRQALSFETYDAAGVPGSEAFPVRVQRNGEFFSVAIVVEQPDADMLEREGLDPNGALYKVFNTMAHPLGRVEKKTREYEGNGDLREFVQQINQRNGEDLRNYVFDHVNIPEILNYLATTVIIQNNDQMAKNYFVYRDTEGTGEWSMYPWDLDLTFGLHFMSNDSILDDTIWADKDEFKTFANVEIWPSHPFVGDQDHPANRSWNRFIDALYEIPEVREMYLRRLRSLMDDLLQEPNTPQAELKFEKRLDVFTELLGNDAVLDKQKWASPWSYGQDLALAQAIQRMKDLYFAVRRTHLYETHSVDSRTPEELTILIPEFTDASFFVPSDNALGETWTTLEFDDGTWESGPTGLGFENSPRNFIDQIKTRVKPAEVSSSSTSLFVRIPFNIDDLKQIEALTLRMKFDDGFVAYLNGTEVARSNLRTNGPQSFDSRARSRPNSTAVEFANFPISQHIGKLREGENVLAIQVLNSSATGSDLLVLPELVEGNLITTEVAGIPHEQIDDVKIEFSAEIDFDPASGNQSEEYLILKNPNEDAVDISGWTLTGSAHTEFSPGVVIPSHGQLYVAAEVPAFRSRSDGPTGNQGNLVQAFRGNLSNSDDTLRLWNTVGNIVDEMSYQGNQGSGQQSLRITEVNFNPYDALPHFGENDTDNDSFEFVELLNPTDQPIDLGGVQLLDLEIGGNKQGVAFTFDEGTLQPGEYAVVVKNRASFTSRYGSNLNVVGEFSGKLSNGGETLTLVDANSDRIQQFRYNDKNGWPQIADGTGATLQVIDVSGDYNDPSNWNASTEFLGSPGTAGEVVPASIVINEISSRTDPPAQDQIELFNLTDAPVDVSGWFITDSSDVFKYSISPDTMIPGNGYVVFNESQLGFGFKGAEPDNAVLLSIDEDNRPQYFADAVEFESGETDKSWSRIPNGDGEWKLVEATFGQTNLDESPRADFNNDGVIDRLDIDLLCQETRSENADNRFDLSEDGSVDDTDLDVLVTEVIGTSYGDANLDGVFNSRDLVLIFQVGQYEDGVSENSGWSDGDWNCDGEFDTSDLVVAFQKGDYKP